MILLHKSSNHSTHIRMFVRLNEHSNLAKFIWALVYIVLKRDDRLNQVVWWTGKRKQIHISIYLGGYCWYYHTYFTYAVINSLMVYWNFISVDTLFNYNKWRLQIYFNDKVLSISVMWTTLKCQFISINIYQNYGKQMNLETLYTLPNTIYVYSWY